MDRFVVLDSTPLWLACKPRGVPEADRCRAWLQALDDADVRQVVAEIADYEVRRELLRTGATASLRRLDTLIEGAEYDPLSTPAMRRAAEFWALIRRSGQPTADPHALDADCIVAAQASLLGGPGDVVTIATKNVRHLARFPGIDAQEWWTIV